MKNLKTVFIGFGIALIADGLGLLGPAHWEFIIGALILWGVKDLK